MFPNLQRWFESIRARGCDGAPRKGKASTPKPTVDEARAASCWPNCRDGETLTPCFFVGGGSFLILRHFSHACIEWFASIPVAR